MPLLKYAKSLCYFYFIYSFSQFLLAIAIEQSLFPTFSRYALCSPFLSNTFTFSFLPTSSSIPFLTTIFLHFDLLFLFIPLFFFHPFSFSPSLSRHLFIVFSYYISYYTLHHFATSSFLCSFLHSLFSIFLHLSSSFSLHSIKFSLMQLYA
ncbi:unnamed protein product [Acanthosepion pharaonis]|uniref:Uncharacterized protein n=1 Tax=Acanthosepion pharaonis TaxID=158019 RepID=A0A812EUB7_ACAPH|nr:unnamed protein product [Sepia pharaonis]